MIVVGLTPRHLGPLTPRLAALARQGRMARLDTVTPAVTCSVQATFMTGVTPQQHGIVGNGWLFRDQMEVLLWRQSNRLVDGEKIWEAGKKRDSAFTCANMFWWYNMASSHDIGATPRPIYKADGRKLPDCYTVPAQLRERLTERLGQFPLFQFWGPATTIASTRWIAEATKIVMTDHDPTLTLAYLPHLDYDLQRFGPDETSPAVRRSLAEIDAVAGDLADAAQALGRSVVVLSEYGITPVDRPIHINRALRDAGLLAVREEDGAELLDPTVSSAFAISDHQIAHIYVARPELLPDVRRLVASLPGVEHVFEGSERRAIGLDHARSGEFVAMADARSWFTYYYWKDDRRAPDFARTVEIHRKPGYDPVELFVDPSLTMPKVAIGKRLLLRKLGFRALMDVIPLDASLVRGSHGRLTESEADGPLVIASRPELLERERIAATDVKQLLLDTIFG
ncbi:alkaline phosphatase family protein [Bradyrhizobium diazoefficiens]|nr:nucleotide pyrophosphatase/phosphodiesterase family protein [Bradyrhizobium diazoefficiens]MBR0846380.1 alkaline phosphatase family protein [Bradyrhizobium diazoefficiens]